MFSSPCFEFQVVRACWVGGPASFVALLVLFLRRVVLHASIGLRIEGRSVEESMSGKTGGGPGVPAFCGCLGPSSRLSSSTRQG